MALVQTAQNAEEETCLQQDMELCMNVNLKPGVTIGMGSYGRVFTAQHQVSGGLVAVKEILIDQGLPAKRVQKFSRELDFCTSLRHPYIVQYFGHEFAFEPDRLFIYLEYCAGGSVASQLRIYGALEASLISHHTSQLLQAMHYLHSRTMPVVHRDLKCSNILLTLDGIIKVADFGSSKRLAPGGKLECGEHTVVGSIYWMAPEVLENTSMLTTSADIWSIGCCVLEMATARHPWADRHMDNMVVAFRVIVESQELPPIANHLEHDVQDFIHACLQRDPALRPTVESLMEHMLVQNSRRFLHLA